MRFKTCLKIDLDILETNYKLIKKVAPNNQVMFVIKSNAYGLGMVPIVHFAFNKLGINCFGCASLGEAVFLRNALPNLQFDLYVFSDLDLEMEGGIKYYLNQRIIPVISSIQKLRWFLEDGETKYLPLCLKFDTGMNRLGFKPQEMSEVLSLLKRGGRSKIYHLMSHFACASQKIKKGGTKEVASDKSFLQYALFRQIKEQFKREGIIIERSSMANSGAIEQGFALDGETHIRPGILMYGISALNADARKKIGKWPGKNVSSLETNIIDLYQIKKGASVGYGATSSPNGGTLVYIALGYGDGFLNLYNKMKLKCNGVEGKIVGRISMDVSAVLFSKQAEKLLKVGDRVVLWDHSAESLLRMAEIHKTIPYEILCNISDRVPRVYIGGGVGDGQYS